MIKAQIKISPFLILLSVFLSSCATGIVNNQNYDFLESDIYLEEEYSENINGLFPDHVYIKTKTQTFNSLYEFQLYKGKIFYKDIDGKNPELWTIFNKTGLPENKLEIKFDEPKAIVEISADSDELYVLSDGGIFYNIKLEKRSVRIRWRWVQETGFPEKTTLRINSEIEKKKSWAMSRRGEEVLWYEDINGNQHHYGTIGVVTNYFLMNDGQEIKFADPGLPSDFSHNILGPERGTFIAESLSASASTVFVINSAGEMYTRLIDYDTVGSDPMFFKYTYDGKYLDERPGSEYRTNFNYWALPAENWRKQPEIELGGQAMLTKRISILQNGRGNDAREMRVAGTDASGEPGFYYKQLRDTTWSFKNAPLKLVDFLETGIKAEYGPAVDNIYYGKMWYDDKPLDDIDLLLDGFNIYEGSCVMNVSNKNGMLEIDFHPVEMWYYLPRHLPGRDGTAKLFMVTLDVPEENIKGLSEYFSPFDLETFAFTAEAVGGCLIVESAIPEVSNMRMVFVRDKQEQNINPEIIKRYHLLNDDPVSGLFNKKELSTDKPEELQKENRGELMELIHRNREFLTVIKAGKMNLDGQNFSTSLSDMTYSGIEKILNITGLYRIDYPKLYTVTMHSGVILDKIKRYAESIRYDKKWMYDYYETHIERRINYYYSVLENDNSEYIYYENPVRYLEAAGLNLQKINRGIEHLKLSFDTSIMEYAPAAIIIDENNDTAYALEFINFENEMVEYIKNNGETPLRLKTFLSEIKAGKFQNRIESCLVYENNSITIIFDNGREYYRLNMLPE